MKVIGLIAEYNPFHNGHLYHIEKSKEVAGADAVIVVMSGNFVQRGTPAWMPKHLRAEMALRAGASVVFELPVCYASGSAELFAMGAVSFLDALGCVDALCFGSECGEIHLLEAAARILADEPEQFKRSLQEYIKQGLSFPTARQQALRNYMQDGGMLSDVNVLESPNNILGIEYLKALYRLNSPIRPFTIQRMESSYHDQALQPNYSSASAIRNLLAYTGTALHTEPSDQSFDSLSLEPVWMKLEEQLPDCCLELLQSHRGTRYPIYANDCSLLLKYKLLSETRASITRYQDITEELGNKIINRQNLFLTWEQFCTQLKSKDITYTRINRALLHVLLGIRKTDVEAYSSHGYHFYAHMLGFRMDSRRLLTRLKKHTLLPILTKLTNTDELSEIGSVMLHQEIYCSNVYESIVTEKFHSSFIHEYEQTVVRV